MADEKKLNKSGNRRGMSKGSQEAAKKNSFKNKPKEKLREISEKGQAAYKAISTTKKTLTELAKEEAEEVVTNSKGEKVTVKRAFIKKLKQMGLNGNLNAMLAYFKMLDEMPADRIKTENTNLTPQIIVKNQTDAEYLKKIENVKTDKNIL